MHIAIKYIKHYITSRGPKGYGIHSPSLFKLVTGVIHDFTPFYCYAKIEAERNKLLTSNKQIEITELGTGSKVHKGNTRLISSIAKYSLKPLKQAQLLFRLINHFNFKNILEIGTSLGITTSYLARVNSKAKVITLEGCIEQLNIAKSVFKNLELNNITPIQGSFNETLTQALSKFDQLDFVFFDGNHTKDASIAYFELCLPLAHNDSMFVFDDIHLNPEMEEFWNELKLRPEVKVTLDLFHLGIVFFRKQLTKENFNIRF